MVILLSIYSDSNIVPYLSKAMAIRETDSIKICEVTSSDGREMVKGRLRTLLELSIAIGRREGLLGKNGNPDIKGGRYVANKGS